MSKRIWRDQAVLRLRGWLANWMPPFKLIDPDQSVAAGVGKDRMGEVGQRFSRCSRISHAIRRSAVSMSWMTANLAGKRLTVGVRRRRSTPSIYCSAKPTAVWKFELTSVPKQNTFYLPLWLITSVATTQSRWRERMHNDIGSSISGSEGPVTRPGRRGLLLAIPASLILWMIVVGVVWSI